MSVDIGAAATSEEPRFNVLYAVLPGFEDWTIVGIYSAIAEGEAHLAKLQESAAAHLQRDVSLAALKEDLTKERLGVLSVALTQSIDRLRPAPPATPRAAWSDALRIKAAAAVRACLDRDQADDDSRPLALWIADCVLELVVGSRLASGGVDAVRFVPGVMFCAKCKLRLARTNLYVRSGTVGPGDNVTEPCPNGCGPLWPVTWEQEARDAIRLVNDLADRLSISGTDHEVIARQLCATLGVDPDSNVDIDGLGTMQPLWVGWASGEVSNLMRAADAERGRQEALAAEQFRRGFVAGAAHAIRAMPKAKE